MSTQSQANRDQRESKAQDNVRGTLVERKPEQIKEQLQIALRQGLTIVEKAWSHYTRDWATSIHVADLDGDGDAEVIVGSYDGRVQVLTKWGTLEWERTLGNGKWICTVAGVPRIEEENLVAPNEETRVCVIAGSRDGYVYGLNQRGKERWKYPVGRSVRQVYVNPDRPDEVIIGSENGHIYALDSQQERLRWEYPTGGAVRCLCSYDIDEDGEVEILAATDDNHVHVLDSQGKPKGDLVTDYKVYALFVANLEGKVTLLASTSNKALHSWTIQQQGPDQPLAFQEQWSLSPANSFLDSRIHAIYVVDINSDNQPEILIATEDKYFYILDRCGKPLWKHFLGERAASIYAADIDRDGFIEIIAGMEDNQVQALRVDLDKSETLFTDILGLYEQTEQLLGTADFSIAERQLLQDLVKKESPQSPDEHKEWAVIELFIQRHEYERALPLLMRLRRQRVQHFWSRPITDNGHICTITSGDMTNDDVYSLLYGTEEGNIKAIDIAASKGKQIWLRDFGAGIPKIETQTLTPAETDVLLVLTDGKSISVLDSEGNLQRELTFEEENDIASTLYIHKNGDRQRDAMQEVIIGLANKKIYIYDGALQQRLTTISTEQGNCLVCTHDLDNSGCQQIITATPDNRIYVYTRGGERRWYYSDIDGLVRALCASDIDGDGYAEVIVGSEDRNVYVLDHEGHLKWRYRTPHRVLAVSAADVDGDGHVEVLVGVEDCYMYVLNGVGDLVWKYKANDRITAIYVQDLHTNEGKGNNSKEIAVGSEDELQLLQVLRIKEVTERINTCWRKSLDTHNRRASIFRLMQHENEDVRTLALAKLAGQIDQKLTEDELKLIQDVLENNSPEVRLESESLEVKKELARIAAVLDRDHNDDPKSLQIVRRLLQQLSTDRRQEIKLAVLQWLPRFRTMSICFEYLDRFSRNSDLWVRRTVVRQLDKLAAEYPQQVFPRLLNFCKDEDKWILQETGRSFAHYFAIHQTELFLRMPDLFAEGINPLIIQQMAYSSNTSNKDLFEIMANMHQLNKKDEAEITDLLGKIVLILQKMSTPALLGSEATLQKYEELRRLFQVKIIDDIEQYQWACDLDQIREVSRKTGIPLVFPGLSQVIDIIKRYRRRLSVGDRLAGLIQVNYVLADLQKEVRTLEDKRVHEDLEASQSAHTKCPPEDHILEHILDRWAHIILSEIQRVRGEAKLNVELKDKYTHQEELVVVSLQISNTGRSPAENVYVRLEKSPSFQAVGHYESSLDEIATHQPVPLEFNIRPSSSSLRLVFDITYDDAERTGKKLRFAETLNLRTSSAPFKKIPNPYIIGLPLRGNDQDRDMFFGRQEELQFLQDKLTNPDANNTVVLSGQRRSGKTSLLYRFMGEIADLNQDIAVLIDLQSLASVTDVQQLLQGFSQEISTTLKSRGLDVPELALFDFDKNPTASFSDFLDAALPVATERKLILLVDEFEILDDKIKKGEISPDFLKYLRSLMQHQPGITFLFAGAPKIRHMTDWYWAAFFNTTFPYTLSKLNTKDAEDLMTLPVSGYLEYDELAIEKIHRLTGDQPYLIHIMSEMLIRLANKKKKNYITVNDVNIAVDQVIDREDHFIWIWNQERQSTTKHFILSILAQEKGEEGRIFSLADIKDGFEAQGRHFERDRVTKALNELVEEGFVEEEADGTQYRIPVGLTRAWLRKVKPPERVAREEPVDEEHA